MHRRDSSQNVTEITSGETCDRWLVIRRILDASNISIQVSLELVYAFTGHEVKDETALWATQTTVMMISISLVLSETSADVTGIVYYPSCHWYSLCLLTEGWPGWVDLGG